jgi:hypothetical protein
VKLYAFIHPLRRRTLLVAAVVVAAGAAAAAFPIALQRSDGASVSQTARKGWILHEKIEIKHVPYAGAGRYILSVEEKWVADTPTRSYRATVGWSEKPVEVGGDITGGEAYDPKTKAIYSDRASRVGFPDPTDYYRQARALGTQLVIGRTQIDGSAVEKVVVKAAVVDGIVFYVDRTTNRVVRFDAPGLPLKQPGGGGGTACSFRYGVPSTTVMRVLVHEYLKPTEARLRQLDLEAQHPNANHQPTAAMPTQLRQRLHPSCGSSEQQSALP